MFQVAEEICTNCGVELENTSLPNGNFIVDSNQFINDEQFGDVICLIALENGMFATINENDKLEFIFKKTTEGMVARLSTEDSKNLLTEDDNFIVVSNMDIIDEGCFDNDNYYRYVKISMLNKILLSICKCQRQSLKKCQS